ncbi:hypothetical protein NDU88_006807 [Pleurodeles waltl]|uniref:Uncharacterized protein n=1 Tax=Pleurodeles waltl TaxID=8319 RepID=A0AAV7UM25_PLEWA|nr:hypothetical protein NDU88_006807 [Pleurodeles waltl]
MQERCCLCCVVQRSATNYLLGAASDLTAAVHITSCARSSHALETLLPNAFAATASAAFVCTAFARSRAKKRVQPSCAQTLRDLELRIQLEARPIDFKVARLPKSANPRPIVGDTSQLRSLPGTEEKTLAYQEL